MQYRNTRFVLVLTRMVSPMKTVRRYSHNLLQFMIFRVPVIASLTLPVTLREQVSMTRYGLQLVVALLAQIVIGTPQAVVSRPAEILSTTALKRSTF